MDGVRYGEECAEAALSQKSVVKYKHGHYHAKCFSKAGDVRGTKKEPTQESNYEEFLHQLKILP